MKPPGIHEQGSEHIIVLSVSEMFDLETNQHVQRAVSDRQMPTVEYRKIQTDDYSECFGGNSRDCYAGAGWGGRGPPAWGPGEAYCVHRRDTRSVPDRKKQER